MTCYSEFYSTSLLARSPAQKTAGTIPALNRTICWKIGWERSKCFNGELHHPPALFDRDLLWGHRLVAVTTMEPKNHCSPSLTHLISKHAPQLSPSLKSALLNAALFSPYPWLYKSP